MIWEGEPLPGSEKRLQEMNIKGQVFSPCFAKPDQGDFFICHATKHSGSGANFLTALFFLDHYKGGAYRYFLILLNT
jgi:hypothetical protein